MLDAARGAKQFAGSDHAEFMRERLLQAAVEHQLMILGEAAKAVSQRTRERWPSVPWHEMARMRDVLIHHYFGTDLEIVWTVATEELDVVIAALPPIIGVLESEE